MDPAAVFATLTALGGTAPRTFVVGCEVENVDEGMGLSEPVAAAVPGAVAAINDVVANLAAAVTTSAEG
jgi:hydrogenase maturation protease